MWNPAKRLFSWTQMIDDGSSRRACSVFTHIYSELSPLMWFILPVRRTFSLISNFFRLARRSGTRRSLNRFSARDHWKQFCIILINFSEASLRRAVNETSGSIIRKPGENMNWPPLSSPTHSVTDSRLARSRWLLQYPSNLDHLHRLRRRERDLSCGQENLINFRFSPLRYKLHSHRTTFQMIHLLQKAKSSPIIVPVVHSVYCSSEVLWGKKLHMKINILVSSSRQWVSMP